MTLMIAPSSFIFKIPQLVPQLPLRDHVNSAADTLRLSPIYVSSAFIFVL
jgi:hypothetical protein